MLVYRAETDDGRGPFMGFCGLVWDMSYAMEMAGLWDGGPDGNAWHDQFPSPYEEGLGLPDERRCACASLRQWVRWFPRPCREVLADRGFELIVYEVPDVHCQVGRHQVLFNPEHAVAVAVRPLV